jgi:protocatechuate 3,4-dioxygenase beta subunit
VGIYRLLNCICMLFQDGEKLKRMYSAKQLQPKKVKVEALEAGPTTFTNRLDHFHFHVVFRSKKTNILRTRWAIYDKNKFSALIDDLKDLIDQLRNITSSVANLKRQCKVFANEISSTSNVASLKPQEEALKEEGLELSKVAS